MYSVHRASADWMTMANKDSRKHFLVSVHFSSLFLLGFYSTFSLHIKAPDSHIHMVLIWAKFFLFSSCHSLVSSVQIFEMMK